METTISPEQKSSKRIHPHKFTLWVSIGSICMMFAALTSAYIVKKNQGNFLIFEYPFTFNLSTVAIILSSVTIHISLKAFAERLMQRYRLFLGITLGLGMLFTILQVIGFSSLKASGVALIGAQSNPSSSFFLVIVGLHAAHVLGGIAAILVRFIKLFTSQVKTYNKTNMEMLATYWHFVDLLWIYLFIFLHLIQNT